MVGETSFLLPRPKDLTDLIAQMKFFIGRSDEPARFGRFSYIEKFDYWAVYWGCVIMIGSGAMLWFEGISLLYIPKYGLDIARKLIPTRHSWRRWRSSSGTSTTSTSIRLRFRVP